MNFDVPETLPETAVLLVAWLSNLVYLWIPIVAGFLGERTVHFMKKHPWFAKAGERERSTVKKLVVQVLAIALPILYAWGAAYLNDAAAYLDKNGYWAIILLAWPVAHALWLRWKGNQTVLIEAESEGLSA